MTAQRRHFTDLPPAQQAGILCNDPRFQTFAAKRSRAPTDRLSTGAAAEYLRQFCQVTSRRDLNTDQAAQTRLAALRTEFDAWTGRIARPDQSL